MTPPAAQDLLNSTRQARAILGSLRAETRAEYRSHGRRIRFQGWILAEHPDRFFLEAGGFGISASLVSVASGEMQIYVPAKSRYLKGSVNEGLKALFGLNLSDREWTGLLLEGAPEIERVGRITKTGRFYRIAGESQTRLVELTVDPSNGWVSEIRYLSGPPLEVKFGKPMDTQAGAYPSSVRFATSEGSLLLEFQKVESNPSLKPESFRLNVPAALAPAPLDSARDLIGR
ncbi:MAG: DUF4292 domain-containing protein [Pseudomonadota bacterium]